MLESPLDQLTWYEQEKGEGKKGEGRVERGEGGGIVYCSRSTREELREERKGLQRIEVVLRGEKEGRFY